MTKTLILKELRQHWLSFLLLAFLLAVGFMLVSLVGLLSEEGSILDSLRIFLATFVVVAMMVLCNRLVVLEYQGKTQLFLEALPVTRLRMVAVKFVLGLGLIALVVSFAFAFLLLAGARREVLTPRFVEIVAARTYAFLLCAYAFFFLMGLLGRYRIAMYLALIITFTFLAQATTLEIDRFGPFALLDDRFAFEREQFPVSALWVTLALAGGCMAATMVLSLVREGSVATLLAEKMSHREKVFVALLLMGLMLALSIYDERAEKAPLDLPGSIQVVEQGITVKIQVEDAGADVAGSELARRLHDELRGMREYLRLDGLPPVFVVLRRDLDGDRYERAKVEGAEGVLVRANFTAETFQERDFVAWLLREILLNASHGRAGWEPRRWLLDGFALFWSHRTSASTPALEPRRLALRAVYGAQLGFTRQDLEAWLRYRERVGDDIAAAVAWSALAALVRNHGEAKCRAFLAAALRTDVPGDLRGWWYDLRHPWPGELSRTCGVDANRFFEQWRADLTAAEETFQDDLARVPRLDGELVIRPLSPSTRTAAYRLVAEPPPASDRFRLLYADLGAFDKEVPPTALRYEDRSYRADSTGELPETYARGSRLFWTFAVRSETLGCNVISGWRRQEVR